VSTQSAGKVGQCQGFQQTRVFGNHSSSALDSYYCLGRAEVTVLLLADAMVSRPLTILTASRTAVHNSKGPASVPCRCFCENRSARSCGPCGQPAGLSKRLWETRRVFHQARPVHSFYCRGSFRGRSFVRGFQGKLPLLFLEIFIKSASVNLTWSRSHAPSRQQKPIVTSASRCVWDRRGGGSGTR
jgi:hypothetical protein